jgi:sulfite reductase (NADPH) flavoprotein alpha-component
MAHDVDTALHTIVRKEGNMSAAQAEDYVQQLKSENRYLRDVY